MKRYVLVQMLAVALGFSSAWLHASPLDDKIATLQKAMKQELADRESKSAGAGLAGGFGIGRSLGSGEEIGALFANFRSNGDPNAAAALQQALSQFSSPAVQTAGQDVIAEIQRERDAKVAAYTASVDALMKSAPQVVLQATKPADLDQLLAAFQHLQSPGRDGYGMDPETQRASQQAGSAYQFVSGWQDYLSNVASGKIQEAQNELRNLAQNNYGLSVPRSEILDRANRLDPSAVPAPGGESAEQMAEGIQSLDNMAPVLRQIEACPAGPANPDLGVIIQTLRFFVTTYDSARAGLPLSFGFGSPNFQTQINNPKLYEKLFIFLLGREFDQYKGPPPTPDETPLQYLESVFADAEQREDWHELQQAYLADSYLERNSLFSTGTSPRDMTGFESMLAGVNQETAEQYAPAVVSYEQALKNPNTYIPSRFIGERLSKIQKDHPSEYADGLRIAGLNPSAPPQANPAPAASGAQ